MFDIAPYEKKFEDAVERFEVELKKVRTGRAHPSMLESVRVEAYGSMMPLNQVANVTTPEPQMLLVSPFDPSQVEAITAAIRADQSLGFNPSDDGRVVRVPVPALTEERRKQLVKQTGEKVEDARIALRSIRQDALKEVKRLKDAKDLSEDEAKRVEKSVDEAVARFNGSIDEAFKLKEQDILKI